MLKNLVVLDAKMYRKTVKYALAIYALLILSGVVFQLVPIPFISGLTATLSYGATFLLIPAAVILSIVHYYRHLYSRQGYLTQTLPVTPGQRYRSKLISAFLLYLLATIVALCGLFLLLWSGGDLQNKLEQYHQYNIAISTSLGVGEGVSYLLQLTLWFWLFFSGFALYSFCITLGMGRRFANFGLGGPVLVYIMTYFISQVLSLLSFFVFPLSLKFTQNASGVDSQVVAEFPTNLLKFVSFGEDLGLPEILARTGGVFKLGLGFVVAILVINVAQFCIAQCQMKNVNLR